MSGQRIWIRGGTVVCPASGFEGPGVVEIVGDTIAAVHPGTGPSNTPGRVIDADGAVVAPGFVDLHAHLGEPGDEYKEDLETAGQAAVRGGFTSVCASPDTHPVNDSRAFTEYLVRRGAATAAARILPIGALTVGCEGKRLTEMYDLCAAGAVALGDGQRSVADAGLFRRAMEYAKAVGVPVFEFPEDASLSLGGVMHEGRVSTQLGLRGVPCAAEDVVVHRAIELVRHTGARVHLGPISTHGAVMAVKRAKEQGLPLTCAVAAAQLHLLDASIAESWSPHLHVRPPLRSESHREALRVGLQEGVIDAVTSNHRPQGAVDKEVPFARAEPGMSGLQTTLGLVLRLVEQGILSLSDAVARLAVGPADVLGMAAGRLTAGAKADVVVFDPSVKVRVESAVLASRSKNTPFLGQALPGRVLATLVGGRVAYGEDDEVKL